MSQHQVGDILTWDFQADVFQGRYQLVEHEGGSNWIAESLPPTEVEIDAIIATGADHEARGFSWLGTIEEVMAEVERRQTEAGRRFKIRMVSAATYAAAF